MIESAASPPLVQHLDTFPVSACVSGPGRGPVVVMFADPRASDRRHHAVSERLHVALIRTVWITPDRRLTVKSVTGLLEKLCINRALLIADQCSGPLAWQLAAAEPARFSGLVCVDVGHPAVPDTAGVVRDRRCPPVGVDTTALAGTPAAHAVARASGQWIRGDFRLVKRVGAASSADATSQLVTEIVLRSYSG